MKFYKECDVELARDTSCYECGNDYCIRILDEVFEMLGWLVYKCPRCGDRWLTPIITEEGEMVNYGKSDSKE